LPPKSDLLRLFSQTKLILDEQMDVLIVLGALIALLAITDCGLDIRQSNLGARLKRNGRRVAPAAG
jgi:hypothetical protein